MSIQSGKYDSTQVQQRLDKLQGQLESVKPDKSISKSFFGKEITLKNLQTGFEKLVNVFKHLKFETNKERQFSELNKQLKLVNDEIDDVAHAFHAPFMEGVKPPHVRKAVSELFAKMRVQLSQMEDIVKLYKTQEKSMDTSNLEIKLAVAIQKCNDELEEAQPRTKKELERQAAEEKGVREKAAAKEAKRHDTIENYKGGLGNILEDIHKQIPVPKGKKNSEIANKNKELAKTVKTAIDGLYTKEGNITELGTQAREAIRTAFHNANKPLPREFQQIDQILKFASEQE